LHLPSTQDDPFGQHTSPQMEGCDSGHPMHSPSSHRSPAEQQLSPLVPLHRVVPSGQAQCSSPAGKSSSSPHSAPGRQHSSPQPNGWSDGHPGQPAATSAQNPPQSKYPAGGQLHMKPLWQSDSCGQQYPPGHDLGRDAGQARSVWPCMQYLSSLLRYWSILQVQSQPTSSSLQCSWLAQCQAAMSYLHSMESGQHLKFGHPISVSGSHIMGMLEVSKQASPVQPVPAGQQPLPQGISAAPPHAQGEADRGPMHLSLSHLLSSGQQRLWQYGGESPQST
jgi:hypothetical protein